MLSLKIKEAGGMLEAVLEVRPTVSREWKIPFSVGRRGGTAARHVAVPPL